MTINFANIPQNQRKPLFFAEVNNSNANTATANQRTLIIGQITSSGVAVPNVPILSQGPNDARTQGGQGSILALMTQVYRMNDSTGEVWYLPLADAGGATAATGTVTFTASPTANGTLALYIAAIANGSGLVSLPVLASETVSAMATALAAAINAIGDLPVTASASSGVVTLTAKNAGLVGNDIDIRLNYQGAVNGEVTPAGLGITIVAMSGGATNPTLTTALTNLNDKTFDFIVNPYGDTTSMDAVKALLNDQTGRWSFNRLIYGHSFSASRGTAGTQTTYGEARNNQHETVMGFYDSPSPSFAWAAAVAGASAVSLRADPGLPLHTLVLNGVLAPPVASRFNGPTQNALLFDGISTFDVGDDGTVVIDLLITTYQLNGFGQPDNSYLKVETMFLIMYVLRAKRTLIESKYGRKKLGADGSTFGPGANVVTPSMIAADLVAQYRQLEAAAYVQNGDAYKASLLVQKDPNNPNRVNVLSPDIMIDQLDVFALLMMFQLQ